MGRIYCRTTGRFQLFLIAIIIIVCTAKINTESLTVKHSTRPQVSTSKLNKEVENLSKEVEGLKQKVVELSKEISETSSSLVELNRKLERINLDITSILEKIELLSQEISSLKRENIEIKQNLEQASKNKNIITENADSKEVRSVVAPAEINISDYDILDKKIDELRKELQEIKETQKLQTMPEVKDPNLRRILTSPYLVLTTLLISIFALIAAF
ncbi:MAG: hypothetical protein NZ928_07160 [Endomicrobia bacterium]|nr:hypothetical protein [Endomicrobiia bacterium]MCX7941302.1 hypothetical protein [Endomicrobiia bacterium]MDW8055948.1 hypothetical protein [Elusimicrobiota bacterium]